MSRLHPANFNVPIHYGHSSTGNKLHPFQKRWAFLSFKALQFVSTSPINPPRPHQLDNFEKAIYCQRTPPRLLLLTGTTPATKISEIFSNSPFLNPTISLEMDASCQCGRVSFKTPLPKPLALYICHCEECRRQSSSAFGCSAIFPKFPLPCMEELSVYS
jgi:hypothetical protein